MKKITIPCLLMACYNLWVTAFKFTAINSDSADTLMLLYGLKEYGLKFLTTWHYTIDNWLLSLFPWHAVLFSIFRFNSLLMVLCGLMLWGLTVIICSLIANHLHAKNAALIAPLLILCAGSYVYQNGLIFFFITHNITNLLGLIVLLLAIRWIQQNNKYALPLIFLISVIAGISDPWFLPCYGLPLLLANLILWKLTPDKIIKNKLGNLLLIITSALISTVTKLFGLFYFLPKVSYKISNWKNIFSSFIFMAKYLGFYINFFPIYISWASVVSLMILITLVIYVGILLKQKLNLKSSQKLFFITAILSMIILPSSYLFNSHNKQLNTADFHFFINFFVLAILGLTIAMELLWKHFNYWSKSLIVIVGLMYVFSGLYNIAPLWWQKPKLPPSGEEAMLKFLVTNNLKYGYADYGNANIITALSQNTIKLRPLNFSMKNGKISFSNFAQSSPLWYTSADISPNQKNFFIYLNNSFLSVENKNLAIIHQALIARLGEPLQTYYYQGNIILVWEINSSIPFSDVRSISSISPYIR